MTNPLRMGVVLALAATTVSVAWAGGGIGVFGSYWTTEGETYTPDEVLGYGFKAQWALLPAIFLEGRWSQVSGETEADADDAGHEITITADLTPLELGGVLKSPIGHTVHAYVGAGGGYYMIDPDLDTNFPLPGGGGISIEIDDAFGWYALGGVEYDLLPNVALFAEVKYTWLTFEETDIVVTTPDGREVSFWEDEGIDVDSDFTGFAGLAGVLVKW